MPNTRLTGSITSQARNGINGSDIKGSDIKGSGINKRQLNFIIKTLEALFPDPAIPLNHSDTYTLLIAVVLSAQCTDKRVNLITPALFSAADTAEKMAGLPEDQIREIIRPCGLAPQKARAIKQLSELLVARHSGRVPSSLEELLELPGVGRKTASVVLTQAIGIPAFPVDTHIMRLAKRWKLSVGNNPTQTETDLKKLFPENLWGTIHLQMIYYGRTFCPARGHKLEECVICNKLERWRQ